jgi:hypothetical protein
MPGNGTVIDLPGENRQALQLTKALVRYPYSITDRGIIGLKPPTSRTALSPSAIKGFAIHYTASDADWTGDPYARWRGIQYSHMHRPGSERMSDIAYSFGITRLGKILEGRGWDRAFWRTGAQGEDNGEWLAIAYLGTDKEGRTDVTASAQRAVYALVSRLQQVLRTGLLVAPHSSLRATSCPGNEWRNWIFGGVVLPT